MAEIDKVSVRFDADVNGFNRGVSRMERKLAEFDAVTQKTEKNFGKRFDLMDKQANKLNKTLTKTGDDVDLSSFYDELDKVRKEYKETGTVANATMKKLDKAIKDVDFDSMSKKSQKAFKTLTKDVKNLKEQAVSLNQIKFADRFKGESKIMALSLSKAKDQLDSLRDSDSKLRKQMKQDAFAAYTKNLDNVNISLDQASKELKKVGRVSDETMTKINKGIKDVDFKKLSGRSAVEFNKVRFHVTQLNNSFKGIDTSLSLTQRNINRFSKTSRASLNAIQEDSKTLIARINRIGTAFRNVEEVLGGTFKGVVMAVLPAIVPMAGAATTSIMAIGASTASVVGGVVGLGGAFGIAGGAAFAFVKQATSALQMLEDKTLKVTAEVKNYQSSLKSLKKTWESLIAQNQAAIFNTMTNGINAAKSALIILNPFLTQTANQIAEASLKMYNWVTSSQNALAAFEMINTRGPAIFQNILNSAGYLGNGLTRMFTMFGPLFSWTAQGLENLSKKFDLWVSKAETQTGIKSFIDYTKANLPVLGSVFGNTFLGIINLFKAFSGQTEWALKGLDNLTERFKNWAATLDQSQGFKDFIDYTQRNAPAVGQLIGNIVNILVQFVKATAPVGEQVLKIANVVSEWVGKMLEAHPVIGRVIASLIAFGGIIKVGAVAVGLLLGPLGRLKGLFGLLIGTTGKATLATKLFGGATLANNGIIGLAKGLYSTLATQVKRLAIQQGIAYVKTKALNLATKIYTSTQALLKTALMVSRGQMSLMTVMTGKYSLATKAAAIAAKGLGLAIRFMTGPVGLIMIALGSFIALIIHLWKTNADFRNAVFMIWNSIKNGAISIFTALKNFFANTWNNIKNFSINTWNSLKSGILSAWNSLKNGIVNLTTLLKNFIVNIFNGLKRITLGIWGAIKSGVIFIIKTWITAVKLYFTAWKNFLSALWNVMKATTLRVWIAIKNGVINIVKNLYNGTKTIFNYLKNFIKNLWLSVKNTVIKYASQLWSGVKRTWNNLVNGTKEKFDYIKRWLTAAWTVIKRIVTQKAAQLWSSVKRTWQNLFNGTRNIFNSLKNWITKKWGDIKRSVTGIASSLWSGVKRTFINMKNGLKSIIDKIKGHINGMVNSVKKGLNKLIDGVNWVAGKIGMDKLPKLKLHTGTTHTTTHNLVTNGKINQDTFATVGDKGRGNGPGGFRNEMIRYPNGKMALTPNKDTTTFLPKGSSVYNGAQTHAMLSNLGQTPRFSTGTMFDVLSNKKKPKAHKHGDEAPGDVIATKGGGGATEALLGRVVDSGKMYVSKALGAVAKGKNWLSKTVGDVLDWIDKPGKLLDKVLDGFGVNFDFLKGAEIPFKMMTAMFKKLKQATVDLFTGWLEDSGGGEGGWVDISKGINFPFSPNGRAPGYPFPYPHMGVDLNYVYDKLYSTHGGVATGKTGYNGGFGNSMWIKSGIYEIIYGHMSKLAWTGSKKVHPGSYLGVSGNTGMSSGPHLHYEMRKNGVPINPMPFLKSQTKGKGGRRKSPSAWRPEIVRAAKAMGVNPSNRQINGIIAQIQRESGGDAGITQSTAVRDINALTGNLAQGLLQYVPSTFRNFAVRGHTNIKSGYDQLLAFFNNSNWANDIQYGNSGWGPRGVRRRENGGVVNSLELAWLADGGFSESVISHDPKNKVKSKAIWDRTGEMLGYSDDYELLKEAVALLAQNNEYSRNTELHTRAMASNGLDIHMDKRKVGEAIAPYARTEIKRIDKRMNKFK
ncbi:TPA: peptidoglycan DD-metalloendopeptidase family protein [Staphylococcus pseudintermedius]|uniref:peptidoglycan DD-metalloendopeptidase family protein n=1 Tax=Staphylococcus pseudintermedius TaxID=283734 RepID=UPI001A244755|nr:peptidoglycan DD-metalloendopeptidase family protein [Staphylococcus pseudintermedius]EIT0992949.1 peptidoglycan DD-metalloendopeptidase family protein [Staphylococcus pseudintermedius]EIU0346644.1 peptidoglycan DD-metalloendopeptidase family protein [Staphylococcus pseudintermedius]EJL7992634.1 peptidoglycan DD-metalloendopeptidase family protein [Staphylococcus pseudintermedius]EKO9286535.1 peptidoglycan DD-metalloendopeptidase family protein [Staphylococcus pseudintermedius]MBJ8261118.1 